MFLKDFTVAENFPERVRELPKKFKEFPDYQRELAQKIRSDSFSPSVVFHVPVVVYVHALLQELVQQYEENRGGGELKFSRIKKWYGENGEGVFVECLQEFCLAAGVGDKNYLQLPSHHHRSALLLYMFWMAPDEIWNSISKELIAIRVFDGAENGKRLVDLYCAFDEMNKQPKGGKLKNSHLAIGTVVSCRGTGRLGGLLCQSTGEYMMGRTRLGVVASLLYAMENKVHFNEKEQIETNLLQDHPTVYGCRGDSKVGRHINKNAIENEDEFPVSDETLQKVADAIEDFMVFKHEFELKIASAKQSGLPMIQHQKILRQVCFLAYYLQDRCVFHRLPAAKKVADKLYKEATGKGNLAHEIQLLWNGPTADQKVRTDQLDLFLTKR